MSSQFDMVSLKLIWTLLPGFVQCVARNVIVLSVEERCVCVCVCVHVFLCVMCVCACAANMYIY